MDKYKFWAPCVITKWLVTVCIVVFVPMSVIISAVRYATLRCDAMRSAIVAGALSVSLRFLCPCCARAYDYGNTGHGARSTGHTAHGTPHTAHGTR